MDVITSVDKHLESLEDVVAAITGITRAESVPDARSGRRPVADRHARGPL